MSIEQPLFQFFSMKLTDQGDLKPCKSPLSSFGNHRTTTMLYNSKKFMIIALKHASKTSYFQDRILQHQEQPLYKQLARLNMCTPLPIPWIHEICQPLQAGFPLWEVSCIETSIETVEPSLGSWASITNSWAYYPVRHLFTIHLLQLSICCTRWKFIISWCRSNKFFLGWILDKGIFLIQSTSSRKNTWWIKETFHLYPSALAKCARAHAPRGGGVHAPLGFLKFPSLLYVFKIYIYIYIIY